jgi:hypothetical protein
MIVQSSLEKSRRKRSGPLVKVVEYRLAPGRFHPRRGLEAW